jgi:hydrogenase large subunit
LHALDWVDVISALKADPKKTSELAQSLSPWPNSSPGYFRDLQARLAKFAAGGQLGPFKNGYWGNPSYKLPAEANLMAVAHYLEALDFQREIVKIHTVFGGKNPHPNWLVGGVPCSFNVNEVGAVGAINMERLNLVSKIIDDTITFVDQVYIPDVIAIASFYKDWGAIGGGLSSQNVMSYGEFPDIANDDSDKSLMIPRGAILNGNLKEILPIDLRDPNMIQEFVTHSWYKYPDESKGLHPWDGVTEPNFVLGPNFKGTKTAIDQLDESAKYSWIKAPRYRGQAMEVGPLARYIVGYAMGKAEFKEPVDKVLKDLNLPLTAIFSTLGRTAARALEASWAAHKMKYCFNKLMTNLKNGNTATANVALWDPSTWPAEAKGVGFSEAPRGSLGHWLKIRSTRIDLYQCIVPTTWNGGPRDVEGNIGAFEAALLDTPIADPKQPLEILRTLHSFDPCLACSTHVLSPAGEELTRIEVR